MTSHGIAPSYDGTRWPLFRIRLPPTALSEEQFEDFLQRIDALFLRGEQFAVVIDARGAPPPTPRERQEIGKRVRLAYGRYPTRLLAMALVLDSALQRGIFTAINWISGPAYPSRAFDAPGAAEAWLLEMLGARAPNALQGGSGAT